MQNQNDLVSVSSSSDVIEHFGVRGMKWGIRRKQRKEDRRLKKASKARSKEWKQKYQDRSRMTDEDIRKATNRLRLENDFAEQIRRTSVVSMKPPGYGKKIADKFIDTAIQTTVHRGVNYGIDSTISANKRRKK